MYRHFFIASLLFFLLGNSMHGQTLKEKLADYRFDVRIKGPSHKRSDLLEIKVDKNNNYLAATFAASSYRYIHLHIYRLYTWEVIQELRINAKRIELYNSAFDQSGSYFYGNTDVYKNEFLKIDLKSGEMTPAACSEVPGNGCRPLEVRQYETEAYTVGENYFIFKDPNFANYIKVYMRKELHKIKNEQSSTPDFLTDMDEGGGEPDFMKTTPEEDNNNTTTSTTSSSEQSLLGNTYTLWMTSKELENLNSYGYTKVKRFDVLINDNLSETFAFDKVTTSTIVLPKSAIVTLQNNNEWVIENLRIAIRD